MQMLIFVAAIISRGMASSSGLQQQQQQKKLTTTDGRDYCEGPVIIQVHNLVHVHNKVHEETHFSNGPTTRSRRAKEMAIIISHTLKSRSSVPPAAAPPHHQSVQSDCLFVINRHELVNFPILNPGSDLLVKR